MELVTRNTAIPSQIVDIWQKIVDSLAAFIGVPGVMINRFEPPDLEIFRANSDFNNPIPAGTRMPMLGVYCLSVAEKRKSMHIADARKDPEWADSPTAQAGIYAYLGFPLLWPRGEVFGTLCAVDTKGHRWEKGYYNILHAFKDSIELDLALVANMEELDKKNRELEFARTEVKTLQGLLPICAQCKKIREDRGYWNQIESYIDKHSGMQFSRAVCPDCADKVNAEYLIEKNAAKKK
jgi:GAF domain-containing protein